MAEQLANDGTPLVHDQPFALGRLLRQPGVDGRHLIARAPEERCSLDHYWEQAALLPHFDQLKVARALAAIEL